MCTLCSNGVCDTTVGSCSCDVNTCVNGCCNGGTAGSCDLYAKQTPTACGSNGASCSSCGTSACNSHADGLGQTFNNCTALGKYDSAEAIDACTAYAISQGGSGVDCTDGWACTGDTDSTVCYGDSTGTTCINYCWGYAGSEAGFVYTCACPDTKAGPTWN